MLIVLIQCKIIRLHVIFELCVILERKYIKCLVFSFINVNNFTCIFQYLHNVLLRFSGLTLLCSRFAPYSMSAHTEFHSKSSRWSPQYSFMREITFLARSVSLFTFPCLLFLSTCFVLTKTHHFMVVCFGIMLAEKTL